MKKALVLNISHNELGLILALKELGYYVIGTGGCPGLIGEKYVDEYIKGDYSNKDLMLKLATEKKVDSIVACCNDFGVLTAAYVAEKLGLPGHDTYQNALTLHHKDLFKQFARKYGIQTPQAVYFDNEEKALNWLSQAEYPIIVKPIDLTGGKGVSRADNHTQAVESVKYAFQKSRANHIVIEPFIEGTQHAMCTFLVNQKVVAVGSNNEYSLFDDPYKVEIATFPADYINEMQQCLVAQVEKMAEVLHLKDGIFHMQYIVRDGKPYIIECMRRVLGNMYGIPCSKLNGFDWYLWQSKVYCGYSMDTFPKDVAQSGYWASRPVYPKADGTFKQLHIPADFERFIFKRVDLQQPGYVITDYHQEILSLLFMRFDSNDEMHHILVDRYEDIRVEVE